ncbi:PQQ-binding-like beta-propeller repeat protein [Streptomyces sp. ISL-100]|nr:PQQ-binding-like beta-propeller repeat protein [Streptomyces sp. ISL-100]
MEALRQDDPRRVGPYALLLRLRETASAVQYLAQAPDDGATAVVAVARPELAGLPAFRRRFQAEAQTAERLAGGWVQAPLASRTDGPDGAELWTATAYVPALTLAEAVALAGPLPERAVRILGAALAETLSRVHATGAVLHGLAADTVLLAADGPRLTAFGALGAAAAAEAGPGGQLSVRLGYLTPEQLAGQEPGPASDIFVLGLLLAYAATGATPWAAGPQDAAADRIAHAEPELAAVPEELRTLIARCLAKSPADRPAPGALAAELALEGAAALARHWWLPSPVTAALAEQAAALEPGTNQARPAIEDTSVGRLYGPGVWGPAPSSGEGRVGESAAGPTGAADVDSGLTRRLRAPRRAPAPALTHPATALALPPATAVPPAPTQPTQQQQQPAQLAPMPATAPARTGAGPRPLPGGLTRRGLFTGIAAGAAGLVVGGGGALAFSGGDEDNAPTLPVDGDDAKPAARRKPLPGVAPDPLWHYQHPLTLTPGGPTPRIWRDQVLLIPGKELTTALDMRTGRPLWEQKAAGTRYGPEAADDSHCFIVTASDFLWLSAKDGLVKHRAPYEPLLAEGRQDTRVTLGGKVAADGPVVWFSGKVETLDGKKDKVTRTRTYLFAYDMAARKELWRTEMPNGRPGTVPRYEAVGIRPGSLLVCQDTDSLTADQKKKAKGKAAFVLIDRRTGKTLWRKFFPGVRPDAGATDDPSGRLYAADDGRLRAYDTRSGKKLWKLRYSGPADAAPFGFGHGVVREKTLYVANGYNDVYAVDTTSGTQQWKRSTEYPGRATPRVTLSDSGRTVFALNATQATAIGARDGRRLWKFQDSGVTAPGAPDTRAPYRAQTSGSGAVLWRGRNFYALPLD